MKVATEVACDAGKAFSDYRRGHLTDVVNGENFLYLAGDNHKEGGHFTDGSYLSRLFESGIWQVYSPQRQLLREG